MLDVAVGQESQEAFVLENGSMVSRFCRIKEFVIELVGFGCVKRVVV